jgi:hypothetical protein
MKINSKINRIITSHYEIIIEKNHFDRSVMKIVFEKLILKKLTTKVLISAFYLEKFSSFNKFQKYQQE